MSWNATFCAPVAASPESWSSAVGEIVAGEAEERHEGRRQRAAIVEEVVDGMADVKLIDGEGRQRRQTAVAGKGGSPGTGGIGVGGVGGVGGGGGSGTSCALRLRNAVLPV